MKYKDMMTGSYIIRTKELPEMRSLLGSILHVDSRGDGRPVVRHTSDCIPKGEKIILPLEGDDGCWYDVSHLVASANSCICPPSNTCEFTSHVAQHYRNYIGLDGTLPFIGVAASGKICILGDSKGIDKVVFDKNGYFVIDVDDNGFCIAYKGFCDYIENGASRTLQLKVIRVNGNTRNFYPADKIVKACCRAYEEDLMKASSFRGRIMASTGKDFGTSAEDSLQDRVQNINLTGV